MKLIINNITYASIKVTIGKRKRINIDFTNHKIDDEVRGYVFWNKKWDFCYNNNQKSKVMKKIAIVLESPHKDEFDICYKPIRIANGLTGVKINNKIVDRISKIIALDPKYIYEIYLMNPVQYQCSLYHELKVANFGANIYKMNGKHDDGITCKVFRALFFSREYKKKIKNAISLREDFINRINKYQPDYMINCCTSSLKEIVFNSIKDTNCYSLNKYLKMKHPSCW